MQRASAELEKVVGGTRGTESTHPFASHFEQFSSSEKIQLIMTRAKLLDFEHDVRNGSQTRPCHQGSLIIIREMGDTRYYVERLRLLHDVTAVTRDSSNCK